MTLERLLADIAIAIIGACFGSFANMAAVRLHEESSMWGRSRCPACKATLKPRHLVPVLSWLILRGRCAFCRARIHIQYPLVEMSSALLFLVAASRNDPFGPTWFVFVGEALLSIALLIMVVMDARWRELPVELMMAVTVVACIGRVVMSADAVALSSAKLILALAPPVLFFGLQWLISRGRWIGAGDLWFGAMMGAALGAWQLSAIALYLSYLFGGVAVAVLFLTGRVRRGSRVPFAPALAAGLLTTLWIGSAIETYVRSTIIF